MNAHEVMLNMKYDKLIFKSSRCFHFKAFIVKSVMFTALKISVSASFTVEVFKYRILKRKAISYSLKLTAAAQEFSVKKSSVIKISLIASKIKEAKKFLNIVVIKTVFYFK